MANAIGIDQDEGIDSDVFSRSHHVNQYDNAFPAGYIAAVSFEGGGGFTGIIRAAMEYGIILAGIGGGEEDELRKSGMGVDTVGYFFEWDNIEDMLISPTAGLGAIGEASNVWAEAQRAPRPDTPFGTLDFNGSIAAD